MKRALNVLRENIRTLLAARGQDASSWAEWVGHDKSWASKVLTGERELRMSDLDRTADFFGVSPYQLLQPGISPLTERRIKERRSGIDRRIGRRTEELQLRNLLARRAPEANSSLRRLHRRLESPDEER
jgi:hypothetical protein